MRLQKKIIQVLIGGLIVSLMAFVYIDIYQSLWTSAFVVFSGLLVAFAVALITAIITYLYEKKSCIHSLYREMITIRSIYKTNIDTINEIEEINADNMRRFIFDYNSSIITNKFVLFIPMAYEPFLCNSKKNRHLNSIIYNFYSKRNQLFLLNRLAPLPNNDIKKHYDALLNAMNDIIAFCERECKYLEENHSDYTDMIFQSIEVKNIVQALLNNTNQD